MPPIHFATQSYESRALPLSAQRAVNYFAESQPRSAKSQVVVFNSPGTKTFGDGGLAGAVRGSQKMGGVLFIVAGNTLYSVDSSGVETSLGTINTHNGRVSMAVNQASPQELAIVDGTTDGWIYDTTNGLVQITDVDFVGADTVTQQDGYFIFNQPGTGIFYISALNDGTSYSGTDFSDTEGAGDDLVAVYSNHREMWAFGTDTIEVYFNSGNLDFPFERINGAFLERGCAAAFSIADDDNTLFWLAEDGVVYRAEGYTPKRISTHAIEEKIRKMSSVSDAFGFFVTIAGHKLYHLTFPTGEATFVYDAATGLWHDRESLDKRYWRGTAYTRIYGKDIVGDAFVGRLGELDPDTFTEYGSTMQGILTSAPIHVDRRRVFHNRLELDFEFGVGLTAGGDPQVWLDYSDDGGRSFSARKPMFSIGKIGEYQQRLRWVGLGQSRSRVYRVTIADPVKRTLIAAHLDFEVGDD